MYCRICEFHAPWTFAGSSEAKVAVPTPPHCYFAVRTPLGGCSPLVPTPNTRAWGVSAPFAKLVPVTRKGRSKGQEMATATACVVCWRRESLSRATTASALGCHWIAKHHAVRWLGVRSQAVSSFRRRLGMPCLFGRIPSGGLLAVGLLAVIASPAPNSCETCTAFENVCANPKRFSSSSVPAVYGGACASGAPLLVSGDTCQQRCPDGLARKFGQAEILTCASGKSSALPLECSPSKQVSAIQAQGDGVVAGLELPAAARGFFDARGASAARSWPWPAGFAWPLTGGA